MGEFTDRFNIVETGSPCRTMVENRPEIKFSAKTGEETRTALNRYKTEENTTQEQAIRDLLPHWAFEGRDDPTPEIPGRPLTEIKIFGEHVTEWEYVERVAGSDDVVGSVRLYYNVWDEHGFDFCAVTVDTVISHEPPFADENTRVSVLAWGRAFHDGIGYTQFGHDFTDNRGSLVGNPYDKLRAVFDELDRLEEKYHAPWLL
jgi:hypothetical protein